MCSDAPKIVFEDRKLWSYLRPQDPKATQLSMAAKWQFLTIGPESEWHQAVALVGKRRYPFSVKCPLILPHKAGHTSTVNIIPFRRAAASGALAGFGRQPRNSSPDNTDLAPATGVDAEAYLHVIAYDAVPNVWGFARADAEYQREISGTSTPAFSSTEAAVFACPIMGRRRFSWLAQQNSGDPGNISYRFVGVSAFDDSLREETILSATQDTSALHGTEWSRHLDIDTDAWDWIKLYASTTIVGGASVQSLFWVRD